MPLPANKLREENLGYTLAEIMAVIVILGVLAALALPNYTIQVKKVKNQEARQVLLALYDAQKDYERENPGQYADTIKNLDIEIEGLKNFEEPGIFNAQVLGCDGRPYLASMKALDGNYILYVLEDNATIVCTDDSEDCSAPLCTQMGFKEF